MECIRKKISLLEYNNHKYLFQQSVVLWCFYFQLDGHRQWIQLLLVLLWFVYIVLYSTQVTTTSKLSGVFQLTRWLINYLPCKFMTYMSLYNVLCESKNYYVCIIHNYHACNFMKYLSWNLIQVTMWLCNCDYLSKNQPCSHTSICV